MIQRATLNALFRFAYGVHSYVNMVAANSVFSERSNSCSLTESDCQNFLEFWAVSSRKVRFFFRYAMTGLLCSLTSALLSAILH